MDGKFTVVVDAELAPIMPRYIEIRRQELGELQDALAKSDAETVRLLGHRLKGTGAAYGFPDLTRMVAAIETAGKENDLTAAARLAGELAAFLYGVQVVYGEPG